MNINIDPPMFVHIYMININVEQMLMIGWSCSTTDWFEITIIATIFRFGFKVVIPPQTYL